MISGGREIHPGYAIFRCWINSFVPVGPVIVKGPLLWMRVGFFVAKRRWTKPAV